MKFPRLITQTLPLAVIPGRRLTLPRLVALMMIVVLFSSAAPRAMAADPEIASISGAISIPGERDTYTFSLPTSATLYFDALTNNSNVRWSLTGPYGAIVTSRPFTATDSGSIFDPLLRLLPGDYSMTIESLNGTTNAYAGRLVNLTVATSITMGTLVTNTLAPANETDFYEFNAAAGDQVSFTQIAGTNLTNVTWRLVDPYSKVLFSRAFTNAITNTLTSAGTHTLLIEGKISDPGTSPYSFRLVKLSNTPPPPFTGTNLVIGQTMTSNLVAGATNAYIFTLATKSRLSFDTLLNSSGLTWSLEGPPGLIVDRRAFTSSDGLNFSSSPMLDCPAGSYQLRIQGSLNANYSFRLLNFANATPISTGTTNTVTLAPPTETEMVRFDVPTGGRFYFDALTQSGINNAYWRLFDPNGQQVFFRPFTQDDGPRTFNLPGTYILSIEGYYAQPGTTGSGTYIIRPVIDGLQSLSLDTVVNGAITTPGQIQRYTFTLSSPTRVTFDALTNNTNIRWFLDGPSGSLVNGNNFTSDQYYYYGNSQLNLQPGEYTVSISGNSGAVGGYRFRLLNLANGTPFVSGTAVSVTLNPSTETKIFTFTNTTAGSRVFFDMVSRVGLANATWELVDPLGNNIANGSVYYLSDQTDIILNVIGEYHVLIEGYVGDTSVSGSAVFNVVPITEVTQVIAIDTTISGSIATPGQKQIYTFNLPAATKMVFDSLTNQSQVYWSLDGPTGNLVNQESFSSSDGIYGYNVPALNLVAGDYTLTVFSYNDVVGGYLFRLLSLTNGTQIVPGTPVTATLTPAVETEVYRFNATAGTRAYFDSIAQVGGYNTAWRLVDPLGHSTSPQDTEYNQGGIVFLLTGEYYLLIEGYIYETAPSVSVTFNISPTMDVTQNLAIDATVAGAIATPGQTQRYTFNLASATKLSFDSLTNRYELNWSLDGPEGSVVSSRSFYYSDGANGNSVLNLGPGNYTLSVFGNTDAVGDYRFRLLNLANGTQIDPGVPVTAVLSPANQTKVYRFNATAGTKAYFDATYLSGNYYPYWRLVDPLGNILGSNSAYADKGGIIFKVTGEYYVLIEGDVSDTGASSSMTFNLSPTIDGTQTLPLDTLVSGSIATPGQTQRYTFTLGAATKLTFDSFTNRSDLRWSLDTTSSNVVNGFSFANADANSGNFVLNLEAGDYTLNVSAINDVTGDYKFRLLNLANGTQFDPGTPVTAVLNPAIETKVYRFNATAGTRVFFDVVSQVGGNYTYWRLIDPSGKTLAANTYSSDRGNILLNSTGEYYVLIEGNVYETAATSSLTFNVSPTVDAIQTLATADTAVLGSLLTPGQVQRYTFSLAVPTRLIFDSLTNRSDMNWSLDGPTGNLVNSRSFNGSDGVNYFSLLDLEAGDYTVSVFGDNDAVGGFSFRLLDFAAATLIQGTTTTNLLTPANSSVLYKFFVTTPGDQYSFTNLTQTGMPNAYWRLIDPDGDTIFSSYVSTVHTSNSLNVAGTYVLAIEGYIAEAGNGSNQFDVLFNGNVPLTPFSGTPLVLNSVVATNFASTTDTNFFTFTLASPAKLYFDVITNSSFSWTITGIKGTLYNDLYYYYSENGSPLLSLPAGNYSLRVRANGANGNYAFRLSDVATVTAYVPGTLTTNTVAPARTTSFYRFDAVAGQKFAYYGFPFSGYFYTPTARLFSPTNGIIFNVGANAHPDTFIVPVSGSYVLAIEGYISDTAASGTYAFNLVPVNYTTNALSLDTLITGTTSTPGERDIFTFSLATPTTLYFDGITNNTYYDDMAASLSGPSGVVFADTDFYDIDANSPNPALNLGAGNYTLTVRNTSQAQIPYAFRLLNFANAEPYTPGVSKTNTLSPSRLTALYKFDAIVGQKFSFDGLVSSGFSSTPRARLFSPTGNLVFSSYVSSDFDTFTVNQNGTYVLAVEGAPDDTASAETYAFNLAPVTYSTNTLSLDTLTSGAFSTVGERHYFTFSLAAPARLYFDTITNNDNSSYFYSGASASLSGPTGVVFNETDFYSIDAGANFPLLNLAAGNYILTIRNNDFAQSPYAFRLLNLANAEVYTPGVSRTNTLSPGRLTALYQFTATAGQKFSYDGLLSSGFGSTPYVRLFAPNSAVILNSVGVNGFVDTFAVAQSGTYVLAVEGHLNDTSTNGTYAFNLNPVSYLTNAVGLGTNISGMIAVPGQRITYTFTLPDPRRVYFDVITNATMIWTLIGPATTNLDEVYVSDIENHYVSPIYNLQAGDYQLTIHNQGEATGNFAFRILDTAAAVVYTPGTSITNTVAPSQGTTLYRFNAAPGQKFFYDGFPYSGFSAQPYVRLFSPYNALLFTNNYYGFVGVDQNYESIAVSQDGTYLLAVEGRIGDTSAAGTYAFNLASVNFTTNSISIGAVVTNNITVPGARRVYTFTVANATRLYFDAIDGASAFWSLSGPAGIVKSDSQNSLNDIPFLNADSQNAYSPFSVPEGAYTLSVRFNAESTGGFAFRLLDFADARPITPGVVVLGTNSPARLTSLYQFAGTNGQKLFYNALSSSGFNQQPRVRLFAPFVGTVVDTSVNLNFDTFTLAQNGIYTFAVEGRPTDLGSSGTFSFNFIPFAAVTPTPIFDTGNLVDLVVNNVFLTPASGLKSGQSFTVNWTDKNNGAAAATISFTDRVTVRHIARNQIIANGSLPYDAGLDGAIGAGGTRDRQLVLTLPEGTNGIGALQVTVTADSLNNVNEQNGTGTGEANNSASANFTATIAPYPDLVVNSVSVTPAINWTAGNTVTIQWTVANTGTRAVTNDFVDSVVLQNTNKSVILVNVATNYSVIDDGVIAPGATRTRSVDFVLPNNGNIVGGFLTTVTTDSGDHVFEITGSSSGEGNNTRSVSTLSGPDLQVTGLAIAGSPSLQSGRQATVSWNVVNKGNADVSGSFYDRVLVRNTNTLEVLVDTSVYYNAATVGGTGPIAPNESQPRSYLFTLPDGPRGAGSLEVTVTADAYSNYIPEANATVTAEANNSALIKATSTLAPYPDLRVVNVTTTPVSLASGISGVVHWTDTNSGNASATASWYERVVIANTNLGAVLFDGQSYFDASGAGVLAPGASRDRSLGFTLPNTTNAAGGLLITVTVDRYNNVFENNAAGTAEINNSASVGATSILAQYPDLQITDLAITPANPVSGGTLTITWRDTNNGIGATSGSFTDRIRVRNLTTTEFLGFKDLSYDAAVLGAIAPGSFRDRTNTFRLPDGPSGTGVIQVEAVADVADNQPEIETVDDEANNSTTNSIVSVLADYPDLLAFGVTNAASGLPGSLTTVIWGVTNNGATAATGPWTEQILLSGNSSVGADLLLSSFTFNTTLPPGGFIMRTQQVVIPSFSSGNKWFVINVDSGNSVYETNENNNFSISTTPTQVLPIAPPRLFGAINSDRHEVAGGLAFDGTNYLVGFNVDSATNKAQFIGPSGQALGEAVELGTGTHPPLIAFDGTNYLAVWNDDYQADVSSQGIRAQRVNPAGALIGPVINLTSSPATRVVSSVVSAGDRYLIVWEESPGSGENDIIGLLLDSSGAAQGPPFAISQPVTFNGDAAAETDGTNFMVIYQVLGSGAGAASWQVQARRITPGGDMTAPSQVSQIGSARSNPLAIKFDGNQYLAVWNRDISAGPPNPAAWDLYARFITPAGIGSGNEIPVSTIAGNQQLPSIAFDGTSYLVSWIDTDSADTSSSARARGRFFGPSGAPQGEAFGLFQAVNGKRPTSLEIDFNNNRFFGLAGFGLQTDYLAGDVYGLFITPARPLIYFQPKPVTVAVGSNPVFLVGASGNQPLGYQWRKDGVNLPGQVNFFLVVSNVSVGDSGNYSVMVTNSFGSVISSNALLRVLRPPTIDTQPVSQTGTLQSDGSISDVSFSVVAGGDAPFLYQWSLNGRNIRNATNSTLNLIHGEPRNLGAYVVTVQNEVGATRSQLAYLRITGLGLGLADDFANRPSTNSVTGIGTGSNIGFTQETAEPRHAGRPGGHSAWYSWIAPTNGVATFSTEGSGFDTTLAVYVGPSVNALVPVVSDDDSGGFGTSRVRFNAVKGTEYEIAIDGYGDTSGDIVLQWIIDPNADPVPQIDQQPADQSLPPGAEATFVVIAQSPDPLTYQWYFNDLPIVGQTASTLTLASIDVADAGSYYVIVSSGNESIVSAAAYLEISTATGVSSEDKFADTLLDEFGNPIPQGGRRKQTFTSVSSGALGTQILNNFGSSKELGEPNAAGIIGGASRWFSLRADADGVMVVDTIGSDIDTVVGVYTGTNLFTLTEIASDNNSAPDGIRSLVRFNATAGTFYRVVVDSVNGVQGGIKLNWRLGTAPVFTNTPVSQVVLSGDSVTLSGSAQGIADPVYQWRLNGVEIPGATNTTLIVNNFQSLNSGVYSLIASNYAGTADVSALLSLNSLTNPPLVAITVPGNNAAYRTGTNIAIRVAASDSEGNSVARVDFYNGTTKLGQVSTAPYVFNWSGMPVGTYTLTAVAVDFFGLISTSAPVSVRVTAPDNAKPTVTILSPAANARTTNGIVPVTGKAADNIQVVSVQFRLSDAPLYTMLDGTTNWSGLMTLTPGTNTFRVVARDVLGNESAAAVRSIYYVVTDTIGLGTNGMGTVKGLTNGQLVEVGKGYRLTATPGAGNLFSNWTANGSFYSTNPVLNFLMSSNLSLTANFVVNPFLLAKGTYTGLVGDTNAIAFTNAGLVSLIVSDKGAFSGKLLLAGGNHVFSGGFQVDGRATVRIPRTGKPALTNQFILDLVGNESLGGSVSDGAFNVPVQADKAVYASTNPAPYAGKYTLIIAGTNEVAGDGIGTVTLSAGGTVALAGTLADGTVIGQTAPVSRDGWWPLYVPLYTGRGMVISWVQFDTNGTKSLHGDTVWTKNPIPGKYYTNGLVLMTTIEGGQYVAPAVGPTNRVLALTNATVTLTGGNLPAGITNNVVLTNNNVFVITGTNGLKLTLTPASGLISGSFTHPQSKVVTQIKAVVQQGQTNLHGFFLGTNQSGQIILNK